MTKPSDETDFGGRISATEKTIAALGEGLKATAANLDAFIEEARRSNENIRRDIKEITENIGRAGRTNWSVLIGALGVSLTLATMLSGALFAFMQQEDIHLDREIGKIYKTVEEHRALPVHPQADVTLGRLDERIKVLERVPVK
jgi:hypothetical protein